MGQGGSWEGGSGWGTHVNPWLIHVNVWQKPLQYCKVISLQLIKINGKKKKKRRWQEYTKELYKKCPIDSDNDDGVVTYLQSNILECEVKWALQNITMNKASGGDGIPLELFQILKDDAVTVLHSMCQQIQKTQQWSQDWKRSVFIPIPKKGNAKEHSNYYTIALTSHANKIMFKIFQARLQQSVNGELLDVQAGFRKGKGTRDQISNISGSQKKQENSRKTSTSASLIMLKLLT